MFTAHNITSENLIRELSGVAEKRRGRKRSAGPVERCSLRSYQRFQGDAIGDNKRAADLLDEALLLEAREKPADGLARRADHLANLFVS